MNKIRIGEHWFFLPEAPLTRADILFVDENNRKNQYWRRQLDFPKTFFDYIPGYTRPNQDATIYDQDDRLMSLSHDDTNDLIRFRDRELHRRIYGVWWMNDGQLEYMVGNHYFALQWGEMHGYTNPETGDGFGEYREFQRDICYFIDFVEKDKDAAGGYIAKAKKTGVTQLMALCFLNESSLIREKRFAMMSKSHEDAKGTNMMLFQHALERMPLILKPQIKNITQSKVVFDKPKQSISGSAKSLKNSGDLKDGFKTFIEALPTKEDAFDGPKIWRAWNDEFPKYKSPYPQAVFDKSSESVKLQQQIYGKQFLTSYPPEDDHKGFFEGRSIYFDSGLETLSPLGKTKTGLYKYFVSALNATEGTFDKYGKADQAKAFYMNDVQRKQVENNRRETQKLKRQYPRNEKEAWESGGSGSTFDNIRLSEQETAVLDEEKAGAHHFREGTLDWTAGFGSPVVFCEVAPEQKAAGKEGSWRFYSDMYPDEVNQVFVKELKDFAGDWKPDPLTNFCGAVDPTDFKEKKDVAEGSKNSITIMNADDVIRNTRAGKRASNIIIAEYFDRPDDPDDFYDEVCKSILFFGMYVIVEANKGWVVTRLKKSKLQNFLLLKDKKTGVIRPYLPGDEFTLINTTTDSINEYCQAIARYIRKVQIENEVDWLKLLKSVRLLQQLMNFDPTNTKIFDMVVSFGYCRLAIEALHYIRLLRLQEQGLYDPELMEGIVDRILNV